MTIIKINTVTTIYIVAPGRHGKRHTMLAALVHCSDAARMHSCWYRRSHFHAVFMHEFHQVPVKCIIINPVEIEIRGGGSRRRQRCKRGRGAAGPRELRGFCTRKTLQRGISSLSESSAAAICAASVAVVLVARRAFTAADNIFLSIKGRAGGSLSVRGIGSAFSIGLSESVVAGE